MRLALLGPGQTTSLLVVLIPFLNGADGTQIMAGAALNTLLLIDLVFFVAGVNAAQRTVPEAAAACNTFLIDDIHR